MIRTRLNIGRQLSGCIVLFLIITTSIEAQEGFLILKKRNRNVITYFKGSRITFQLNSGEWMEGRITWLTADSLVITREILRSSSNAFLDTLHYYGVAISLNDVYAVPTTRELINHDAQGAINVIPGHERFLWIKNGFIFRVLGGGYAGLNIGNHLIDKNAPFARDNLPQLATAAGVFLLGVLLQHLYRSHYRLRTKYHFQFVPLIDKNAAPVKVRGF